jgi:hypothetical protein
MNDVPKVAANPDAASSFLRQFTRRRESEEAEERSELCSARLGPVHQHLLDPRKREILCVCDGCAILFVLRIPRRIRSLMEFQMDDLQWESLMIPINLAFFYRDGAADRNACDVSESGRRHRVVAQPGIVAGSCHAECGVADDGARR